MTNIVEIVNIIKGILNGRTIFVTTTGDLESILTFEEANLYSFKRNDDFFVGVKDHFKENMDLFTNVKKITNINIEDDESVEIELDSGKHIIVTYL